MYRIMKKLKFNSQILVALVCVLGALDSARATHILGGELYYDYLGQEQFEVFLKLYSEPTDIGNGTLDGEFTLGVFNDGALYETLFLSLEVMSQLPVQVAAPQYCQGMDSVEILQLVYSGIVSLPSDDTGYDLTIQRCCFGDEVDNLLYPMETGIALVSHVPAFTNDSNPNSSPRFEPQLGWQFCLGQSHQLSNVAWDPDGDEIVYEWLDPLNGGSIFNPAPVPPLDPQFLSAVSWASGYAQNFPFPSETPIELNPYLGMIGFEPSEHGAFVFAIQAIEMREGAELSTTFREMTLHFEEAMPSVPVTFQVDMNNQVVSPDGVHVAGGFQGWDPAATLLTDDDMDGVYEVTVDLPVNSTYEFKFINGNSWDFVEDVPPTCQVEVTGNDNRFIDIPAESTDEAYAVCWESCAACGLTSVRFRVDMVNEEAISPNGVHVAGNFQGWDPGATPLADADGDGVWETIESFDANAIPDGFLNFKFINGNSWTNPNESLNGLPCSDGFGNRVLEFTSDNMVLSTDDDLSQAPCFNSCGACVPPTMVTFRVDMTTQATVSVNGVHVAGSFQGWNPSGSPLSDDDGDGIWEVTMVIEPGDYQFKFINGNDWGGIGDGNVDYELVIGDCAADGSDNRALTVGSEAIIYEVCYNQCEPFCVPNPDPADVTFRVDMSEEEVNPSGVWVMGNFTSPNWQSGALQLTDADSDGVYEFTVNISGALTILYKFVNGDPSSTGGNGVDFLQESGILLDEEGSEIMNFEDAGCGLPNGFGAYNRTHDRSGEPEELGLVCFNRCSPCSGCEGASEVFISEYFEGSGNNKGIELYNPTAESIDLSSYELQRWANGEGTATDWLQLVGVIEPHATHVLVNGQTEDIDLGGGAISPACDLELQALADQLGNAYPDPLYFNGDDALVLVKNGTVVVDIFGKPGEDPGVAWTDDESNCFIDVSDGAEWLTSNHTLRRLPDVLQGSTVLPVCFDVMAEWEVLDMDDWTGLGWHTINCEVAASGCTDPLACNYNGTALENDGSCTYPGCQDPVASNYDATAGCADECIYVTYDCSSIGDEAWSSESIGLFPDWQQAVHGVEWIGEWVLNIPATIVEPGSGVVYGIHHMDWTGLEGLPDWAETVSYESGQLDASTQYCIAASGTPANPGLHEITATGEVFISIFGQPFSIGEQTLSAWLEVAENPNPIPGCMYATAQNFVAFATLDDGSCEFAGCTDLEAGNFNPLATIDDGSCGDGCDPADDNGCSTDANNDGAVNVTDLLMLLGEFGLTCE